MASLTQWTWVWVNSGSWWWTGRPGVLRFLGSQRVGHDWATDLIWSDLKFYYICIVNIVTRVKDINYIKTYPLMSFASTTFSVYLILLSFWELLWVFKTLPSISLCEINKCSSHFYFTPSAIKCSCLYTFLAPCIFCMIVYVKDVSISVHMESSFLFHTCGSLHKRMDQTLLKREFKIL